MTEWEMPETQYAQCGDLSIAFQVLGDGPIDVTVLRLKERVECRSTAARWPR